MNRKSRVIFLFIGCAALAGCLFVRDQVYVKNPDGTLTKVEDKTSFNPDIPVKAFPYGETAASLIALGLAGWNWYKKQEVGKKYMATVKGIELAKLDVEQIETIREAHQLAGVENKVKKDLKDLRCGQEKTPPSAPEGGA